MGFFYRTVGATRLHKTVSQDEENDDGDDAAQIVEQLYNSLEENE